MLVPSSLVRDRVLSPVMEMRAHNLHQAHLIANPTPEPDSITEHLAEVIRHSNQAQRPHLIALLDLVRQLAHSNTAEGEQQQTVAGVVDQLAADLRRAESASKQPAFGVQQLARALRGPLEVLVNARSTNGTRYVTAVRALQDVLTAVPAAHLLENVSLRHELGVTKYSVLTAFIEGQAR